MTNAVPKEIAADLERARRLEWWTIGWMISVVIIMGLTMGSSQAMRTAWVEDLLSLVPAIVFLISLRFERKRATQIFPYGFHRVHSLSFLISAVALSGFGALLLLESLLSLVRQEHVTIPPIHLFGRDIWSGWLMIAALAYSVVPPVILGHLKLPLAKRMQDEVLHTDAMMQKADWMTGLAGIVGILGVGLGYWWADSAAAALISLSILHDGITALRVSTAELIDGAPRELGSPKLAPDAKRLLKALKERYPGSEVRLRETGRFIQAQVLGVKPEAQIDLAEIWPGEPERAWRLAQLSFVPPEKDKEV